MLSTFFVFLVQVWLYCRGECDTGLSYQPLASQCLEEIVRNQFTSHYDNDTAMLLTFIVTNDLTSPAHEIQEYIMKYANVASRQLLIEVAALGERYQFSSYSVCSNETCRKHFVVNYKSNFCIIVMDNEDDLDEMLEIINKLSTFNPSAKFLVYLETISSDPQATAKELLWKLWKNLIYLSMVLIPRDAQTIDLYKLNFTTEGPKPCGSEKKIVLLNQCRKGKLQWSSRLYFEDDYQGNFFNCSIGVVAKPYSPFVIDEEEGFEIELLRTFGKTLNLHLDISLSNSTSDSLGIKRNGSWTRGLKLVHEQLYIAVGNIEVGVNYTNEFEFTKSYHTEPLVLIVPKAKLVPRWRVFVAIFTLQMWTVCLGAIICFALLFFCSNRYFKGSKAYSLEDPLLTSIQVMLGHPVVKQPGVGNDLQRVFFVSLNIFSIIIYCVYTCSLVYYLKNPIREHQMHENSELLDQFDNLRYYIGGINRYKEVFNGEYKRSQIVYKNYETLPRKNETVAYWVELVGNRSDYVTLASQFYVNFLLANDDNITTYPDGQPKLFVFKNYLLTYSVSMMVRKGHPLLYELNRFITKMLSGGFVLFWCRKYIWKIGQDDSIDNMTNNNPFESLSAEHLQGAFAILAMGQAIGLFILLLEMIHNKFSVIRRKRKERKYIP